MKITETAPQMAAVPSFHSLRMSLELFLKQSLGSLTFLLAFSLANLVQCVYVTHTCARSHKHTFVGPGTDTHSPLY